MNEITCTAIDLLDEAYNPLLDSYHAYVGERGTVGWVSVYPTRSGQTVRLTRLAFNRNADGQRDWRRGAKRISYYVPAETEIILKPF